MAIRSALLLFSASLAAAPFAPAQDEPPAPPELWLYYSTNLWVEKNLEKLEEVWRRAARAGYTRILLADSKFAKLGDMDRRYFAHVERVKKLAAELNLEIVPALFHVGYSNGMLWHDPNLAEGLPVKDSLFGVRGGQAVLEPDPPVRLGPKFGFIDETCRFEGGVVTVRDNGGNARFSFPLAVRPYRCYHVSVKIRTENYTGRPEVKALGGGRSLQWQYLDVKPTQDWTEYHVVFNSLEAERVTVYFGVWDDARGTLQWKDWQIEEAPLVNVLRRPGAPFTVRIENGRVLEEGKDFEPVEDPLLGTRPWKGEYDAWHPPVPLRVRDLPDGTRLRVSWYHPAIIYEGQVCACPSEPRTMELLADEARRLRQAWGAKGYMMSHDEIRVLNQDESCRRKKLDAGAILAENVRACVRLLEGATAYVWNDMFDPHHNAHKDYYLVRGDLTGSWEGLDPSVVIVNWNGGKREESLKFFAGRGHRQVIAGYYDGKPEDVRAWRRAAAGVRGVVGVMYTTWRQNYADLEAFARYVRE
jgi:hypothetical protein